jgi:serine/threonine-protein kinase
VTAEDERIGRLLDGRYRIVALIGSGGIGAVYRAEHAALDRSVAVKVLLEGFGEIPELKRRFVREAKALSALSHPHVVPVIDFGLEPEAYLVMELLEGQTLEDLLREGPLPPARALRIARQILSGLAFAHGRGVAHRDLKPANVFLQALPDAQDHVRLLDFGLAKFLDDERGESDATLTKAGMVFGTPAYMAPEQATGERADARADVYSAGILLYELLTGRRPFNDPTRAELLRAHLLTRPPPAGNTRPGLVLSAELQAILDRALAKEIPLRFQDASAMLAALDALPDGGATIDPHANTDGAASSEAPTMAKAVLATSVERPTGRAAAATKPTRSPAGRLALAVVGLAALCGAGYLVVRATGALGSADARTAPAPHGPVAPPPSLGPTAATRDAAPEERPPARDPWIEPIPPTLARARAQLARHEFTEQELQPLKDYVRGTRDDARGHLVLAQGMLELGWRSDALTRYRIALSTDSSVRGDPRALADLADLAQTESLRGQATRLVRLFWGDEALALLSAAAERATDRDRQSALRALRAELTASRR